MIKCLPEEIRWNAILALEVALRDKNALVVTLGEALREASPREQEALKRKLEGARDNLISIGDTHRFFEEFPECR